MPRPKPLVSLHGAVNFDKLVPFDSAPDAPPLAANDILVMRKAAGGDNLTISIGDITATGSVDISQLTGGAQNDMLWRNLGVWQGTGPTGLSYSGSVLELDGDLLRTTGAGGIAVEDTGNLTVTGSGNIEQSGTGNVEITGGGDLQIGPGSIMVAGGGTIQIEDAGGKLIINSDEEEAILLEGDSGIFFDGDGDLILDGSGKIELDSGDIEVHGGTFLALDGANMVFTDGGGITLNDDGGITVNDDGQILAADGDAALPGYAFANDPDTGLFGFGSNVLLFATSGQARWAITPSEFSSQVSGGPTLRGNVAASSTVPTVMPSGNIDSNTGLGRAAADELSLIAGGVEGIRVAEVGAVITNTIFGDLESSITTGPAMLNEAATATNPVLLPRKNQPQTGVGAFSTNAVSLIALSTEGFRVAESEGTITDTIFGDLVSSIGSGPAMKNEGATGTNPVFVPNQADPDTGFTRSGVNQSSIVNGGVEALRIRPTTSFRAASSNIIFWDYDDATLKQLEFGADDSGGLGFKMCRVVN